MFAIGFALYLGARTLLTDPLFTAPVESAYLAQFLNRAAQEFFGRLLFALGLIAAISYAYEKFKNSRELMMSRDEIKQERRNSEGDALIKSTQRRLARRLLQKQMLSAVATADVVVTNPTHIAVALCYDRKTMQAPRLVAKGIRKNAEQIRELARQHGVPIVENKPLARLMFKYGKVGREIPAQLYAAAAEVLAYVYRTNPYRYNTAASQIAAETQRNPS